MSAVAQPRGRGGWRRIAPLFAWLYRAYYRTLRLRGEDEAGGEVEPRRFPFAGEVWALCERDALALAGLAAARGFTALVAHGRDGDWAAAALEALGCGVVRGSSRRGGWPALRSLVRRLEASPGPIALVVDGPLGPAGRARPGALACARGGGRPIRPVAAAASLRLVFPGTWSGIYLPLPLAKVRIVLGEPLAVPAATPDQELHRLAGDLGQRLELARQRAVAAAATAPRLAAQPCRGAAGRAGQGGSAGGAR